MPRILKYTKRMPATGLTLNDIQALDSIAIHHMDHFTGTIDDVTSWHMDGNKWQWIGYGYFIDFDGTIYECRGVKYLNAAVANNNGHVVSIGFRGCFERGEVMRQEQYRAGVDLIRHLQTLYPQLKTVDGHKKWNLTSCPGASFPLAQMILDSKPVPQPVITTYPQWMVDGERYLRDSGFTTSPRKPDQPITAGELGIILGRVIDKLTKK